MATNRVLFISETYFKTHSSVNFNVETQLLTMSMYDAQFLHIQQILGTKLYKKLESLIENNTISDNSNIKYKELLDDYVCPSLVQWSVYETIPYLKFKLMNKGTVSQNSDNSASIDLEELKFLQSQIRDKGEFYNQRIADHIMSNLTDFPEYTSATTIEEMIPEKSSYFSGMQLEDDYNLCDRFLGLNSHTTNI